MEGYYLDDTMMRNEEEAEGEGREEDESQLPGFRFYPTDEELVEFYLRRKVENKPFSLDLIKEIDIYKFDPWDLPKWSTIGDNEWYFFCKRGRKYRNSVRPNRVTGSGFWKATGIDKPIRSNDNIIVGLKKSLVYYTGNAGKGTKTDWMMHEFRLPAPLDLITHNSPPFAMPSDDTDTAQEAEVWTVCRIFKRNVPSRKYTSNWREVATKRNHPSSSAADTSKPKNITLEKNKSVVKGEQYISFSNSSPTSNDHQQQHLGLYNISTTEQVPSPFFGHEQCGSSSSHYPMPRTQMTISMAPPSSSSHPHELSVSPIDIAPYQDRSNEQFATEESWDELRQFWSMFQ